MGLSRASTWRADVSCVAIRGEEAVMTPFPKNFIGKSLTSKP